MTNNANIKDSLTEIKWICYDIYITVDKRVINQDFNVLKEKYYTTETVIFNRLRA
jgi:hypothetical protein